MELWKELIISIKYCDAILHDAHLGVSGTDFYSKHKMYELLYDWEDGESFDDFLDTIQEVVFLSRGFSGYSNKEIFNQVSQKLSVLSEDYFANSYNALKDILRIIDSFGDLTRGENGLLDKIYESVQHRLIYLARSK